MEDASSSRANGTLSYFSHFKNLFGKKFPVEFPSSLCLDLRFIFLFFKMYLLFGPFPILRIGYHLDAADLQNNVLWKLS